MKNKVINALDLAGFTWPIPVIRLLTGESPKEQFKEMWAMIGVPLVAIMVFLVLWGASASRIQTSLGEVPGPIQVFEAGKQLMAEHSQEKLKEKEFYQQQEKRNVEKLQKNPDAEIKVRKYTGKPTFLKQIRTSLVTVFVGFIIAAAIAVPVGILCGISRTFMTALNPLIQIFKPVSPLAWLPIVTMIVSAVYTTKNGMFEKSFINSAITVSLCSLWPALLNTALGVASIDKDYINVARVLQLGVFSKIFKIVLPASLPLIFTGLRISLGVGWMVLIAAEMLAQNPGLGKFVWDEFQNGSSHSLARIMVAVFVIGIIGFMLDRIMIMFQRAVSFSKGPISA
ncbi:MAG: ABC transporter permease [Candidatus Omnitrophota bacterium]